MTRSNKVLLGSFMSNLALAVAIGVLAWKVYKLETDRQWWVDHPVVEDGQQAESPTPEAPEAAPAVVPEADQPPPVAAKAPKRLYKVRPEQSLKHPALLDGMACWLQREAWNKAWLPHNTAIVERNRKRQRKHRKVNDFTVLPNDVIVRPTLEEVARIKATVRCKKGDP